MVQAQTPGNDDQPRRELGASVRHVAPQAAKIISAEVFQQVGIRVHRGVMIAAQRAGGVQQESTMGLQKRLPGPLAYFRLGVTEQTRQLRGDQ